MREFASLGKRDSWEGVRAVVAGMGVSGFAAADNLKRVLRPAGTGPDAVEPDFTATPALSRLTAFLETKTVWHPKGR